MNNLLAELSAVVGTDNVLTDAAARALASSDLFVWPGQVTADLVVRPGSTAEAGAVMRILAAAGQSVVPRGAGLSYTGGPVPHGPAVVLDTGRLTGIEVFADDLYTVVGAGCSWAQVADALRPRGLKPTQTNPISGSHSTVGGTAAQGIPGGSDGIIGLTVVLADGSIVQTGAGNRFWRYSGPDLTGLFLGDCGTLGIKTEVVLRLVPIRPAAYASFGFADADSLLAAFVPMLQKGLVTKGLAMDPVKNKSATKLEAGDAVRTLGAVLSGAGSVGQAMRDAAQLVRGRGLLDDVPWSLHLTVEAATLAGAEAQLALAKPLAAAGREIDNVLPKTLAAKPYSIRGFVGPEGERWVPVHGVLPLSQARACMAALEALVARATQTGVSISWLVSSAGAYMTIEPMFYWSDALDPIHMAYLSERNQSRFGGAKVNEAARAAVTTLRDELRDVMDAHGATHTQPGRFYDLAKMMDPSGHELLKRLKQWLDPAATLNPGALGFGKVGP